jgi:hypothetical protein
MITIAIGMTGTITIGVIGMITIEVSGTIDTNEFFIYSGSNEGDTGSKNVSRVSVRVSDCKEGFSYVPPCGTTADR